MSTLPLVRKPQAPCHPGAAVPASVEAVRPWPTAGLRPRCRWKVETVCDHAAELRNRGAARRPADTASLNGVRRTDGSQAWQEQAGGLPLAYQAERRRSDEH